MTDHPRIWLQPACCGDNTDAGRVWCEDPQTPSIVRTASRGRQGRPGPDRHRIERVRTMTHGADSFVCDACEREIGRRWWNPRDRRRDLPPICTSCDAILAHIDAQAARIAELERKIDGHAKEGHPVEQALGKALRYPWFRDDRKSFPDATEADGVCVGEHVPGTLAEEAAARIAALEGALVAAKPYVADATDRCKAGSMEAYYLVTRALLTPEKTTP